MKANKVAILVVTALLVQTQVTEATFFLDFFNKWHPYLLQQRKQEQQQAPEPRQQVAVPPTTVIIGTAAARKTPPAPTTARAAAAASATATGATFPNIAAAVLANPQLSTALEVTSAVGLVETFADEELVATVFAPTNAAFERYFEAYNLAPEDLTDRLDLARLVLSYHWVPGVAATASSLTDGQTLPTRNEGQTITVIKRAGDVLLDPTGQNAPNARVVRADIRAGKAIVHIIDQVLVPANFPIPRVGDATVTPIVFEEAVDDDNGAQIIEQDGAALRAREIVEEGTALERDGVIDDNGLIGNNGIAG